MLTTMGCRCEAGLKCEIAARFAKEVAEDE
jgi:hypothetical protein